MNKTKGLSPTACAAAGLCLSLCIESMQYVFGVGISEVDDLILNTAGAFVGGYISYFIGKRCM